MIPVLGYGQWFRARRTALPEPGPPPSAAGPGIWRELPATRHLPDPYGPDPVVFGEVPRVQRPYHGHGD